MKISRAELNKMKAEGKAKVIGEKPAPPPPARTEVNQPEVVVVQDSGADVAHEFSRLAEHMTEALNKIAERPEQARAVSYEFDIKRGKGGFIEKVIATPRE